MKCSNCDGTGTTKGWISEPCAYCGGTGELPDDFTEMMKLKNCKKCGGEAVFSGVFDDPPTYRFPKCMECGARAEGNNTKDSWYERARKWNEQNTQTNDEWRKTCSTEEYATWLWKNFDHGEVIILWEKYGCPMHKDDDGISRADYTKAMKKWLEDIHK